jgi:putative restriction endonuclease
LDSSSYSAKIANLADYLEISPEQARSQWRSVRARAPRPSTPAWRQVKFLPVETLLCLAASLVVNHRRYGGSTSHLAPSPVPELAALFKRTPASVLAKMANLDGSRPNGARHEVETAAALLADAGQLGVTYVIVRDAAVAAGVDSDQLPDFLDLGQPQDLHLMGQEELTTDEIEAAIEPRLRDLAGRMGGTPEQVTEKLLVAAVRVGQHRFAHDVLKNCAHRCVFCGLRPGPLLERRGLLVASHIKPWRVSSHRERLDVANGLAACPSHDTAFDFGLLWVNGGLRIHTAVTLDDARRTTPGWQPPLANHP